MASTIARQPITRPAAVAAKPNLTVSKAAAAQPAVTPERTVDVAQFRNLPLSGAPKVSAEVDPTLGKTGLDAWLLNKLEGFGQIGTVAANGVRLLTRVLGPIAYGVSAVRNAKLFNKALHDPTISGSSKVVLGVGTVGTALAAAAATVAALPVKLFGRFGLNLGKQLAANKASGVLGGIAGMTYSTINMIETLRNPKANPADRAFAKVGFGFGAIGFVTGTTALVLSLTGAAPAVMGVASAIATGAGIVGLATWIGQLIFSKNQWLNEKLKGTALA